MGTVFLLEVSFLANAVFVRSVYQKTQTWYRCQMDVIISTFLLLIRETQTAFAAWCSLGVGVAQFFSDFD